jgi:ribulose-phosphate 3-epimerase
VTAASTVLTETPTLSVGIAAADQLHLGDELGRLAHAGVGVVHLDVMDGVYSPVTATAAPALARAVPGDFVVDVHLMVDDPLTQIDPWVDAGAGIVTFQLEGVRHPHRVLQALRGRNVVRGVGVAPGTPLEAVVPLLPELDLLLVLGVNPGWPGQQLEPSALDRIRQAKRVSDEAPVLIAYDGGVTQANLPDVLQAGADVVVSGSAVFDGDTSTTARRMVEQTRAAA